MAAKPLSNNFLQKVGPLCNQILQKSAQNYAFVDLFI